MAFCVCLKRCRNGCADNAELREAQPQFQHDSRPSARCFCCCVENYWESVEWGSCVAYCVVENLSKFRRRGFKVYRVRGNRSWINRHKCYCSFGAIMPHFVSVARIHSRSRSITATLIPMLYRASIRITTIAASSAELSHGITTISPRPETEGCARE